jgi:recombination protein RecR
MSSYPSPLERLIRELSKLPGIGEKTAGRLAFHMLKADRQDVVALADSIGRLKQEICLCPTCFGLSEFSNGASEAQECKVCRNPQREKDKICVVEDSADMMAIEKTQGFSGVYHVLHGAISPLDGVGPGALRIEELLQRLNAAPAREIIVATNPTVEGEATALYLSKVIKPLGVKVTRIAKGIPMGGDLEYADVVTLGQALEGRREI